MNICDKYDWDNSVKEDKRTGSSEITIKWTITDINKTKAYWSGETNGYGELMRGEENGEIILVERAYADAVNNLRNNPGFQKQLSRRFSPAERENQRIELIERERELNPAKCQYTKHETEINETTKYVYTPDKPAEKLMFRNPYHRWLKIKKYCRFRQSLPNSPTVPLSKNSLTALLSVKTKTAAA